MTDDVELRIPVDNGDEAAMSAILAAMNEAELTVKDIKHSEGNLESSLLELLAHDQDSIKE